VPCRSSRALRTSTLSSSSNISVIFTIDCRRRCYAVTLSCRCRSHFPHRDDLSSRKERRHGEKSLDTLRAATSTHAIDSRSSQTSLVRAVTALLVQRVFIHNRRAYSKSAGLLLTHAGLKRDIIYGLSPS
jgi:hypothetical protein